MCGSIVDAASLKERSLVLFSVSKISVTGSSLTARQRPQRKKAQKERNSTHGMQETEFWGRVS